MKNTFKYMQVAKFKAYIFEYLVDLNTEVKIGIGTDRHFCKEKYPEF